MLIITTVDVNFRGKNVRYLSSILDGVLEGENSVHNIMNTSSYFGDDNLLSGYKREVKLNISIETYGKIADISKLTYESLGDTASRILEYELTGGEY